MKKQATKGMKALLRLQILRKAKENPEFEKELIRRMEQKAQNEDEETEAESIRAEAIRRLKVRQLLKK